MNKALICVDVQNDFLPGGALGVPEGHQAIPALIDMMDDVDVIVLTRDWHPADHISFEQDGDPMFVDGSWPPHCVRGTDGAAIDHRLYEAAVLTDKPVLLIHKGFERDIEEYSGFGGIVADLWNRPSGFDYGDFVNEDQSPMSLYKALVKLSVTELRIGGLALDYCVKATALDGVKYNFRTYVHLPATRPVTFVTGGVAVYDMAARGVKIEGE